MLRRRGGLLGMKMGAVLAAVVGLWGRGGTLIPWCSGQSRQRGQWPRSIPDPSRMLHGSKGDFVRVWCGRLGPAYVRKLVFPFLHTRTRVCDC